MKKRGKSDINVGNDLNYLFQRTDAYRTHQFQKNVLLLTSCSEDKKNVFVASGFVIEEYLVVWLSNPQSKHKF